MKGTPNSCATNTPIAMAPVATPAITSGLPYLDSTIFEISSFKKTRTGG